MITRPVVPLKFAALLGLVVLGPAALPAQAAAPAYYFTHVAGPRGGPGNADGPAAIARFHIPSALAIDRQGNVYVADAGNRLIRKISPAGTVSTLAQIFQPTGITADDSGNLYVADSYRDTIYRLTPTGELSVLAGQPYTHYYHGINPTGENRDGSGTEARFFQPGGMAVDAGGNVLVADTLNHTIRKITPAGVVTTLAGTPGMPGYVDGAPSSAKFFQPSSVAVDAAGNIYVSDLRTVRRISPGGSVTTLAGDGTQSGSADGTGPQALFLGPRLTVSATGTIYVADLLNHLVRQVSPAGVVTTLAGAAGQSGFADGPGSTARFNRPSAVILNAAGNLLVADSENDVIRLVTTGGTVSTFAGRAGGAGSANGAADVAQFNQPAGVTVDAAGNLYIADSGNHQVRKISPDGQVTTLSGSRSSFRQPNGVALSPAGTVLSADAGRDRIAINAADGTTTTLAGGSPGFADGPVATARFHWPLGLAVGKTGIIYVADTANKRVRQITPDGVVSTLTTEVDAPNGVAVDDAGNVYVADRGRSVVAKVTPGGTTTILAGVPYESGTVDGPAQTARFNGPCGVAVDREGYVFVTDTDGHTIRRIAPDGTVATIGGNPGTYGSADGVGASAHFFAPHGLAVDQDGTLYITEEWNHAIRRGQPAGPPVITLQPLSQTVAPGTAVQFSVDAASVPDITFQWYVDGRAFTGATGRTLAFTNVSTADAGQYTVVVTNALGSVTSSIATLRVTTTPAPPAPAPGGGGSGGGSSGGGGGAPSHWFLFALLMLGASRLARRAVHPRANA